MFYDTMKVTITSNNTIVHSLIFLRVARANILFTKVIIKTIHLFDDFKW